MASLTPSPTTPPCSCRPTPWARSSRRRLERRSPRPLSFPSIGTIVDRAYVTVVGVKAATQVKVSPSWRIRGNPPIAATPAGGQVAVTLGPFDVLNLETDDATDADAPATVADLSGSARGKRSTRRGVQWRGERAGARSAHGADASGLDCEQHLLPRPPGGAGGPRRVSRKRLRGGTQSHPVERRLRGARRGSDRGQGPPWAVKTSLPAPFDSFTLQRGKSRRPGLKATSRSAQPNRRWSQRLVSRQFVAARPSGTLRWCCLLLSRST